MSHSLGSSSGYSSSRSSGASSGGASGCSCGCCDGGRAHTPADTSNAPARPALRYRVGEHGSFLAAMLAGLSDPALPALAALRTRLPADPAVALLDAGATLLDVLTFYQERIANEGYLRTAVERRSLLELSRLVGYRPRPGLSASAYLAFTVEQGHRLTIPVGTKAQSVPGQDELPQTFETSTPLDARAEWSQLAARRTRPQLAPRPDPDRGPGAVVLWLAGTATGLRRNDPVLVEVPDEATPRVYRVDTIDADQVAQRTRLGLVPWMTMRIGREALGVAVAFAFGAGTGGATVTGKRVLDELLRLAATAEKESDASTLALLTEKTLPQVDKELSALPANATNLRPWLTALSAALHDLVNRAAALAASAARAGRAAGFDFGAAAAAAVRAQPAGPRSAAGISRALDRGLGATTGGTLGVVAALRPSLRELLPALVANAQVAPAPTLRVYALRVRASLFGSNASHALVGFDDAKQPIYHEWGAGDVRDAERETVLNLDARYDAIAPASWVVVDTSAVVPSTGRLDPQLSHFPLLVARAVAVQSGGSRTAYGLTGPSTAVTIAGDDGQPTWLMFPLEAAPVDQAFIALAGGKDAPNAFAIIQHTSVLAGSELLALAEAPIPEPLCNAAGADAIELADLQAELQPGRWVIVSGERTDVPGTSGITGSELRLVAGVRHDVARDGAGEALAGETMHTWLTLASPLASCYRRDTVVVWGNVVDATHGETRRETLGGGDASQPFQRFTLRASPVTYTAAPTATGTASSLEVRVNEVLWHEHDSIADAGPADHAYVTSASDDAKTTVTFGDGVRGARIPTGRENVKAVYRVGLGTAGNVGAGRISLLASRPLGLKDVVNPLPASGGADADAADQIRRNAPLGLQALDRLVSLRDYADFALASAGIGKAAVARLSDGRRELVHVTIAGVDDAPILPTSDLFANLQAAFARLGDARQPVRLAVRELVLLVIAARVRVAPDYSWELVEPHVRAALLDAFGFDRRELGRPVASSEVLAAIAGVPGVAYVDLDTFGGIPEYVAQPASADGPATRRPITPDEVAALVAARVAGDVPPNETCGWLPPFCPVGARLAGPDENGVLAPAQLAVLSPDAPDTLVLTEIT